MCDKRRIMAPGGEVAAGAEILKGTKMLFPLKHSQQSRKRSQRIESGNRAIYLNSPPCAGFHGASVTYIG